MIQLQFGGQFEVSIKRLRGILNKKDVTEWWQSTGVHIAHNYFLDSVKENIQRQGALSGESWDYSTEPKYKAYKRAVLGDLTVLRWKGGNERLYPSLINRSDREHLFIPKPNGALIGSRVDYAGRLAKGGTGPFGERYPARHFIPVKEDQNRKLLKTLNESVRDYFLK